MAGARHFRELDCWRLANELKLGIYRLADRPEVKRDLRFNEQIRDAAASAPRNIAEGFGRRTHADFAKFLDVARGSLAEAQNHLQDAVDRGYLDAPEFHRLNGLSGRAAAAVARLQRYLRGPQR
jgi:four helix bundle protein